MSTRYEGAYASRTNIDYLKPHDEIGDDRIGGGKYALTIAYDECFYIEGTAEEIVAFASRISTVAGRILADSRAPLRMSDFYFESDHEGYPCPKCDEVFEPGGYNTITDLIEMIRNHVDKHELEARR